MNAAPPPPADGPRERDPKLLAAIDTVAATAIRRLFDESIDEPVRDLRDAIAEGLYDALLTNPDVLRAAAVAVPAETSDDERHEIEVDDLCVRVMELSSLLRGMARRVGAERQVSAKIAVSADRHVAQLREEIATLRGEKPHAAAVIDRMREHAGEISRLRTALDETWIGEAEAEAQVAAVRALADDPDIIAVAMHQECEKPVDYVIGLACVAWSNHLPQAREVAALLRAVLDGSAGSPRPKIGDRVEDGGMHGVLVTCPQCDGDGLLHQPDPGEVERVHPHVEPSAGSPETGDTGANDDYVPPPKGWWLDGEDDDEEVPNSTDALVSQMVHRLGMGQRLMPWPELTQDLAFLAVNLDAARGSDTTTPDPSSPLTFELYEHIVNLAYEAHREWYPIQKWRRGQAYANVLHTLAPRVQERLEKDGKDCFYRDDMVPAYLSEVRAALTGPGLCQREGESASRSRSARESR